MRESYLLLAFLGVVLLSYQVEAQDEPQITKEILPEIRRTGTTGRLNCTVTRQANNKVYWVHSNSATVITNDDQIDLDPRYNPIIDGHRKFDVERTMIGDRTTYTLIVRRLQLTDAGTYSCRVHIKGTNNHPSKDGQMVVLIPPTVKQAQTTHTVTIKDGENANLTCNATGYPTPNITWYRANGSPLPAPINQFSFKGNRLMLNNVGKEDRGVYRCIADNNVKPPASFDSTLYVQFTPYARPVQTSYGQAQNRRLDVTIECRVAGYPAPDLRWFKLVGDDGLVPISDDDKHVIHILLSHGQELSVSEFWYQLTIYNVQANDYGYFVCEGTNGLGKGQAKVLLYETSECQGANCPAVSVAGAMATAIFQPIVFLVTLAWTLFILH